MGVSAVRVTACAGVLVGGLMLATGAAGLACADPGDLGHWRLDGQSSKGVNAERAGRPHGIIRGLGERRRRHHIGEHRHHDRT